VIIMQVLTSFLTASLTILGGVAVYVVGQLVQRFFIDPLHEQRRVIGEIDVGLTLWAREWASLPEWPAGRSEQRERAQNSFREYASRLAASTNAIGPQLYWAAKRLGAPRLDDIRDAVQDLIGLSNNMYSDAEARRGHERFNRQRVYDIGHRLGLWVHAWEHSIRAQEESVQ
jgi:hypothetical protein